MKKSELKSIIKECIKEIMFEEGIISNLVAEVAYGITSAQNQLLQESPIQNKNNALAQKEKTESEKRRRQKLLETKKKIAGAIGNSRLSNVFEGTEPLPNTGNGGHSPLSGKDPSDSGVDISGLFGATGHKWKKLK